MLKELYNIIEGFVVEGEPEELVDLFMNAKTHIDALQTIGSEVIIKSKENECPYIRKGIYGKVKTPFESSSDQVGVEYEAGEKGLVCLFINVLDVVPIGLAKNYPRFQEVYLKHKDDYETRGKEIKKSLTQKDNWRKHRGNYMRGIKKAAKEKERNPDRENYPNLNKSIKKFKKENESMRLVNRIEGLLKESEYNIDLLKGDKFDLEELESSGESTEEVTIDDLDVTSEMINLEVFLYDNLIVEFDVGYIHSEKEHEEEEEDNIKAYYFDIVLENHKLTTLLIHKKEENPEMVIVNDIGNIDTISLSKSFLTEGEKIDISKTEFIPLERIKKSLYEVEAFPKDYGYRLESDTKEFFKKEKKNFKNLTNEQKKSLIDSKYFDLDNQDESYLQEDKKFFDALKDFSDDMDKDEDSDIALVKITNKYELDDEEASQIKSTHDEIRNSIK